MMGDFLICIGNALKSENPSTRELGLVFDSIKESPEQFQELYQDFIQGTFIGKLAEANGLLHGMIEKPDDEGKFEEIQKHFKNKAQ